MRKAGRETVSILDEVGNLLWFTSFSMFRAASRVWFTFFLPAFVFWCSVVQVGAYPVFKRLNNVAARIVIRGMCCHQRRAQETYEINSTSWDFRSVLVSADNLSKQMFGTM